MWSFTDCCLVAPVEESRRGARHRERPWGQPGGSNLGACFRRPGHCGCNIVDRYANTTAVQRQRQVRADRELEVAAFGTVLPAEEGRPELATKKVAEEHAADKRRH